MKIPCAQTKLRRKRDRLNCATLLPNSDITSFFTSVYLA